MKRLTRKRFWLNDMEAVLMIMIILIIIGTINIFSASFITAQMNFNNPYYFLTRHLVSLVIGCICFFFAIRFDYHRLRTSVTLLLAFTFVFLVLVLIMGVSVNGARRWMSLAFFQFQPSEIAKIVCIIITASYLGNKIDHTGEITLFNRTFFIVICMAALVEFEPDMGTAVLICGIPVVLHFVAGMKGKWIGYASLVLMFLCVLMVTFQSYRLERMKTWYDPWSQAQGVGYQTVQSLSAIGSGGIWGMGLGRGVSKYSYLPEAHTDFAFAVFSQENGLLAVLFVFFLYVLLAIHCGQIARRAKDGFGKLLACGIMLLIVGQAATNLYMIIGLLPVVGVPLPFISYGGTSLILNMLSIGIIINVGKSARKTLPKNENDILSDKVVSLAFERKLHKKRKRL